ncbi:MAG: glutamate synthase-related protein, partial [Anaerolineae bacterium]
PLEAVEPVSDIVRRFSTAAISHGAISSEAHQALAEAMNRLGAMSNSGEGGEAEDRYHTPRNSAIKQVASGRFGVTPAYLVSARELQIKMAQGAKPGEGGQLPGHKVTAEIAALRHSAPGVRLISPPPHHDIYSIEDLAQLIFDLKQINPGAAVSVKLVAERGVGTIAAGVVKGGADVVHLSGGNGGTGAAPLSSIKHAGLPLEIGLAETQQTLIANDLRDRVRLRVDGGLKTGRDVVKAAILGADEYSFGTAALIAAGCVMARACHNNTCPAGIATQRPELRARFTGSPEAVIAYLTFVARHVREILAELGYRSLNEIIGRTGLLAPGDPGTLNLLPLLATPDSRGILPRRNLLPGNDIHTVSQLNWHLLETARPALNNGQLITRRMKISNTDRSVGATLSGAIAARFGSAGLPEGQIHFIFEGSAGQSFGLFNSPGLHLTVIGQANDYLGKGMAGGEIILTPPPQASFKSRHNTILGNTALYGATGGRLFAAGQAGERFAVRNSGAVAVVEGAGTHACEYMTGGTVVILGAVSFNIGAGMSGGAAFVYNPPGDLRQKLNPDMVELAPLDGADAALVRRLVQAHAQKTGSPHAERLLSHWESALAAFAKITPRESPPAPTAPASKKQTLNLPV